LWVTGAIGTAVGLGVYDVALILAVVTFFTLKALTPLKREPPQQDFIGSDPAG
jgi:putative Mg2+ transporter-C (MgtC) family protein